MGDDDPRIDSMCAIYAQIIRDQIQSADPDVDTIVKMTEYIERYCQTVGFEPGETPEHLEEYLFSRE